MLSIKWIRSDPSAFLAAMRRRGVEPDDAASVLHSDSALRIAATMLQEAQQKLNTVSGEIGRRKRDGSETGVFEIEAQALKSAIAEGRREVRTLEEALNARMLTLPNVPSAFAPHGESADDNVVLEGASRGPVLDDPWRKEHDQLLPAGWRNDAAAHMAGTRSAFLSGDLSRLHTALGRFMLDRAVKAGFLPCTPPVLVREQALVGTGQLPKFADDLFRTQDARWLIPTAEVSLTNLVAGEVLPPESLPLRLTALTPCFRAEAGASGRDTRGLIRQHVFEKVELVTIAADAEGAMEAFTETVEHVRRVMEALGLSYRLVNLCDADLGFAASLTYDVEVWMPGARRWMEISSVSDFGAFQGRRMGARCKEPVSGVNLPVHTVNGSGVAVGRALACVLETHQREDGSIHVPVALQPYLGGQMDIPA